jgi:hypothetical protein
VAAIESSEEDIRPDFWCEARCLCQHELAHHVVGRLAGFKTGIVKVRIDGHLPRHEGSAFIVPTTPLPGIDDVDRYIRRRIVVLLAGAAGEALDATSGRVDLGRARKLLDESAFFDGDKAVELATILYGRSIGGGPPPDLMEMLAGPGNLRENLLCRSAEVVELHCGIILALTEELLARVRPGESACLDARELDAHPLLSTIVPIDL